MYFIDYLLKASLRILQPDCNSEEQIKNESESLLLLYYFILLPPCAKKVVSQVFVKMSGAPGAQVLAPCTTSHQQKSRQYIHLLSDSFHQEYPGNSDIP